MGAIVVAGDLPALRREVISAVAEPDLEIVEASSGPEVLELVRHHDVDLVICDLQMGSMGAMAVCLELRLEESLGTIGHVAVLVLLDRRPDVFLARRSSAEGWLVKPLDALRLRRATRSLLAGGTYHDDAYKPVPVLEGAEAGLSPPTSGSGAPPG